MIDLIRRDGDFYKIYLDKLIGYIPTFYIDISDIPDLSLRYREDTSIERPDDVFTFEEPCYVFALRNENTRVHHILTIDNKVFVPKYDIYTRDIQYIYVPTSMITPTSVIYIQKYYDVYYKKNIMATSVDEYIDLEMPQNMKIKAQDIYLTFQLEYVNKKSYEIYTKLPDNTYKQIIYDDFYDYDNYHIKIIDDTLLNTALVMNISKVNTMATQYSTSVFEIFDYNANIDKDKDNFRLYRNGQLLPKTSYTVRFNNNAGGPHIVRGLTSIEPTDKFTLSYTGDKYHLVYEEALIDEYVIVNVYGLVNKPIDLKWHEIYINGLRITKNEIDIIAPYLFVIKNVPTRKNLQIYQVNLDENSNINVDRDNEDISSELYDNIEEIREKIKEQYTPLEDLLPDLVQDIFKDYIGIIEDMFAFGLINPDLQQITEDMAERYEGLIDLRNNFFIKRSTYSFRI